MLESATSISSLQWATRSTNQSY